MSSDAYRQKVEAKLDEYQAKVDGARARLKGASADARLDAEKQLDDLRCQRRRLVERHQGTRREVLGIHQRGQILLFGIRLSGFASC